MQCFRIPFPSGSIDRVLTFIESYCSIQLPKILPVSLVQLGHWLCLSWSSSLLHGTAGFLSANPSTSCLHSLTRYLLSYQP